MQLSATLVAAILGSSQLVAAAPNPAPVFTVNNPEAGSNPWVAMYEKTDSECRRGYYEAKGKDMHCGIAKNCRPTLTDGGGWPFHPGSIPSVGHIGIFWGSDKHTAQAVHFYSDTTCTTHVGTVRRPAGKFGMKGANTCVGMPNLGAARDWQWVHCVSVELHGQSKGDGPFITMKNHFV